MPATVAHLDEITPVDVPQFPDGHHWLPVRHALGVQAFGVNAFVGVDVGDEIIGEHTEGDPGDPQHEELYFVHRGLASFTVDGEVTEAPAGTFVFVAETTSMRSAIAREPGTTVLVMGAQRGVPYTVSDWDAKYTDPLVES